jgi:enterochelin esterase family protein
LAVQCLPSESSAQSPPNPNSQRQPVFDSFQQFKDRLADIAAVADQSQRNAQLDALWTQLKNVGQIPYVQDDRAALLYRGPADSIAVAGDFNGWNPAQESWQASQLAGTDLWMLEKSFAADARVDYKIVIDGAIWTLDPANPLQVMSGFGPNSELRMPAYKYPEETIRRPNVARGTLTEDVKIKSAKVGCDVNYRVYTPAGYSKENSHRLPVVYVTDGHEYAADAMGSMVVVLDNLIAAKSLQPTIAVFIDPRDPTTGENRRASQYLQNANFAAFLADELAPTIDAAYRTLASPAGRTILGTSLGGLNAAYIGATRSDVFSNLAVQSPASFPRFAPQTLDHYAAQPLQKKLKIYITAGTIGDGNGGAEFADLLKRHGYDFKFTQHNEGHSWGQWRGLLDDILIELIGPLPSPPNG